jgi:hypothetical protein
MKETYLSTFAPQISDKIQSQIQEDVKDIEVDIVGDRFIAYKTAIDLKKLSLIEYLNNTFVLIKRFDQLTGTYFKPIFQWAGRHNFEKVEEISKKMGFNSLRIIINDNSKIVSGHRRAVKALERQISNQTNLRVNRVNPDTEVWILHTRSGYGFILLKVINAK